ncbi:hypothetical protein [Spirochaeta lutea]|nr:hypothetical protein [Spirochaeta lutea]
MSRSSLLLAQAAADTHRPVVGVPAAHVLGYRRYVEDGSFRDE